MQMKVEKRNRIVVLFLVLLSAVIAMNMESEAKGRKKDSLPKVTLEEKPQTRLYIGDKTEIEYTVKNTKRKNVIWRCSNKKVATVSSKGVICAKKEGKAKITAWVKWKKTQTSFWIRVKKPVNLKSLKIEGNSSCNVGDSIQLNPVVYPYNTTKLNCKFSSSKKSVATITKNGWLIAHKKGTTTITLKDNVSKKKCKMTFRVNEVPVFGLSFAPNNVKTMEYGEKKSLVVDVSPANATDKRVRWKSSNNSIATVDENGVVTALRPSENVDITATSVNDKRKFAIWHISITANKGYITKKNLDDLELQDVDKLMIVSHPDDELFWGGAHLLQDKYLVVCVTNDYPTDERKNEFIATMKDTGEKCMVLDYPDSRINRGSLKSDIDLLTTSKTGLMKDINMLLSYKKWEEVITHNPDGEYGKYNHLKVSQFVTECYRALDPKLEGLYYFGKFYWGTVQGERLKEDILKRKMELLYSYLPTAKGAIDAFGHMLPYENWIAASEW